MTTPTPLQRLSEIVEAGTPGPWRYDGENVSPGELAFIEGPDDMDAGDDGRSVYIPGDKVCFLSDGQLEEEDATLIVSAVRLARFLASPEAVEVLAPGIEKVLFRRSLNRQFDGATLATSKELAALVCNTIAEQALKEPGVA